MPGGAPGLQNQRRAEKVLGGFDSHSPPPLFDCGLRIDDCGLKGASARIRNPQSKGAAMEKRRAGLALLLVVVGAALLVYGLGFRPIAMAPSGSSTPPDPGVGTITPVSATVAAAASELDITREVARGGVKRDESGAIKKTYEEGTQAPKACPT